MLRFFVLFRGVLFFSALSWAGAFLNYSGEPRWLGNAQRIQQLRRKQIPTAGTPVVELA